MAGFLYAKAIKILFNDCKPAPPVLKNGCSGKLLLISLKKCKF